MYSPVPSSSTPQTKTFLSVIDDDRAITSLIDQLLSRSGLSNAEVARRLGISPQTLSQYKCGYKTNPSVRWLAKLLAITGGRILVEFTAL